MAFAPWDLIEPHVCRDMEEGYAAGRSEVGREAIMNAKVGRIVVALDFSTNADVAVGYAADLAIALGASIHLLHVLEEPSVGWDLYVRDAPDIRDRLTAGARASLALLASSLEKRRIAVTTELRHGAAAESIVRAAADAQADLIVVGTHGRGGLSHLLLGSVAERVIRHASCPVLAVRNVRAGQPGEEAGRTHQAA
jgi:universal stress protein A